MSQTELLPVSINEADSYLNQTETETVFVELENSEKEPLRAIEYRVQQLIEVLDLANPDTASHMEVEVSEGKYLVVDQELLEFPRLSFFVSSAGEGALQSWPSNAITCKHTIDYGWLMNEQTGQITVKVLSWHIDPGVESREKTVELNRAIKSYDLSDPEKVTFSSLFDIAEQFNKVVKHFEDIH